MMNWNVIYTQNPGGTVALFKHRTAHLFKEALMAWHHQNTYKIKYFSSLEALIVVYV